MLHVLWYAADGGHNTFSVLCLGFTPLPHVHDLFTMTLC
jgi:hypothetical protein